MAERLFKDVMIHDPDFDQRVRGAGLLQDHLDVPQAGACLCRVKPAKQGGHQI
jgi:hypothetical protein